MKKFLIASLFFSLVSVFSFAEGSWSAGLPQEAEVTIINPQGIIGNVSGDKIIYNQQLLCVIQKGSYVKVGVPSGDNVFFIDNPNLHYFEDACLIEAQKGMKYYILVSPVYGYTELKLTDEKTAVDLISGLTQVRLNGEKK